MRLTNAGLPRGPTPAPHGTLRRGARTFGDQARPSGRHPDPLLRRWENGAAVGRGL